MTDWARDHGYPRQAVYTVLSGRSRCTRGRGHQIAIDLGMKRPTEADASPSLRKEGKQHGRRAVSVDDSRLGLAKAGQLVVASATEEASP